MRSAAAGSPTVPSPAPIRSTRLRRCLWFETQLDQLPEITPGLITVLPSRPVTIFEGFYSLCPLLLIPDACYILVEGPAFPSWNVAVSGCCNHVPPWSSRCGQDDATSGVRVCLRACVISGLLWILGRKET